MSPSTHRAAPSVDALLAFLLDRIGEDAASLAGLPADPDARGGARDVSRLAAGCAAKQRVIAHVEELFVLSGQVQQRAVDDEAGRLLRALAAPYSGHPAFRRDWVLR